MRFIPACAGNRCTICGGKILTPGSSPRVRGTGASVCTIATWCRGSSPRVRGTARHPFQPGQGTSVHPRVCGEQEAGAHEWSPAKRFIPACAGNSPINLGWHLHPTGSSPRVRGTDLSDLMVTSQDRFIPACAGNSSAVVLRIPASSGSSPRVRGTACGPLSGISPTPVHPRVCGEQRISSKLDARCIRFIPACAGNSASARSSTPGASGSSPRVRGTVVAALRCGANRRFIPACAGNSRSRLALRGEPPVHPRVCGEQSSCTS